ncbi:LysM peptidoglycan-binding domain-containing protein [Kribbella sp. NPDC050281]|uniref:CIS tube protein n=1 Tax=Kribbella sp. NPDC050281 TaxID=3155515 RepID=UPI0033C0D576
MAAPVQGPIGPPSRPPAHDLLRTPLRLAPLPASNELAKAVLIDTTTNTAHVVMYNPEELKVEQGNQFAEVGIPGLNASPLQYVRGKNRVLTMELFFDTYESKEDVRLHTAPIVRLLDKQPQTLAPPVLLFSLGRVQFRCVLTDAGQRFTMFAPDGTPVRSTMSVRLQEYVDVSLEISQGLFIGSPTASALVNVALTPIVEAISPSAASAMHTVLAGETLSGIAGAYLGDPARWREIAQANGIIDPLAVKPGASLVIPDGSGRTP